MCSTDLFLYAFPLPDPFHVSVSYALHSVNRVCQISKDKTEKSHSYMRITESAQDVYKSEDTISPFLSTMLRQNCADVAFYRVVSQGLIHIRGTFHECTVYR